MSISNCSPVAEKHEGSSEANQQRLKIQWELKDNQFADATLSTRAFTNIEYTEDDIEKFVRKTSFYCQETARWALPTDCQEAQLADSLQKILEEIISHFDLKQRTIYNAHGRNGSQPLTSQHNNDPDYDRDVPTYLQLQSAPAFSIQAVEKECSTSHNFLAPKRDEQGYPRVVCAIEVTTEADFKPEDHKIQVALYARQTFLQQGNRQLVNCLIVSETSIRLYAFGQDGLHYSLPFDIHANPTRFVRFILGAASAKAEVVGFDSTIFFRGGKRWIQSVDLQNNPVEYEVVGTFPFFRQHALGGRGTTCWKVTDSVGNLFLVKDSWKEPALNYEYKLLQDAKGLGGVGQIVGYQNGLASTHKLRLFDTQPTSDCAAVKEKVQSRIVMEYYGETIAGFTSRKQLLEAFDDAISGYKNLHDKNILHRDISVNNILLGKPGAEFPNRGVLIDLDMAIRLDQKPVEEDKDRKAGTRTFQSVNILRSYFPEKTTFPHSYMDDLQSFFYVLCWVCVNYSAPHTRVSTSSVIPDWEVYDAFDAAINKLAIYTEPFIENVKVTPFFGQTFFTLLKSLRRFFSPYIFTNRIVEAPSLEDACNTIQGYVRSTLAALEAEDRHPEKHGSDAPVEVTSPKSSLSKRRFDELDGNSPSKRIKLNPSVPC